MLIDNLTKKLNAPYPVPESGWRVVFPIVLIGILVTLLIGLVIPIKPEVWLESEAFEFILICSISAVVTGGMIKGLTPSLLPSMFRESQWNVGRQILFELVYFWCIGCVLLLVAVTMKFIQMSFVQIFIFVGLTFVGGSIPLGFKILMTQNILLKRNIRQMQVLLQQQTESKTQTTATATVAKLLTLKATTNDTLEVNTDMLLFIRAQQSYSEVHWIEEGEERKYLLRQNIGQLQNQMKDYSIVRCHRSYLVNIDKIKHVTGNAQGYLLHFKDSCQTIPLSRNKARQVLPLLSND